MHLISLKGGKYGVYVAINNNISGLGASNNKNSSGLQNKIAVNYDFFKVTNAIKKMKNMHV